MNVCNYSRRPHNPSHFYDFYSLLPPPTTSTSPSQPTSSRHITLTHLTTAEGLGLRRFEFRDWYFYFECVTTKMLGERYQCNKSIVGYNAYKSFHSKFKEATVFIFLLRQEVSLNCLVFYLYWHLIGSILLKINSSSNPQQWALQLLFQYCNKIPPQLRPMVSVFFG